jgi:ribonuclease T2
MECKRSWRMALSILAFAALLPTALLARSHHHGQPAQTHTGSFDYYVMSLSWAPTFCATHPDHSDECSSPHGFVLHGLWPQYSAGGYPQTCSGRQLSDEERQAAAQVYSSEQLAAHEWAKHGTCSGLDPQAYFGAAAKARDSIQIPATLQPGDRTQKLRAADIVRAIREANPSVPTRAIAVTCGGKKLTEVRVCLDKNLAPQACGPDVKSSCGAGTISIPGVQ